MTLKVLQTVAMDMNGNVITEEERLRREALKNKIVNILKRGKHEATGAAEAETAMRMAVQLSRKAGLELYEIEREMNKDHSFVVRQMELGGIGNWRRQLVVVIADALIVRTITHVNYRMSAQPNKRSGNYTRKHLADYVSLVGMPGDIELVDYLYDYISRELVLLARRAYLQDKRLTTVGGGEIIAAKAYYDDFYRGAVTTLRYRLEQMFKHAPETEDEVLAEDQTMALVAAKEADVFDAENRFFPRLGKGCDIWSKPVPGTRAFYNPEAAAARQNARIKGAAAGSQLELRKALNAREGVAGTLD